MQPATPRQRILVPTLHAALTALLLLAVAGAACEHPDETGEPTTSDEETGTDELKSSDAYLEVKCRPGPEELSPPMSLQGKIKLDQARWTAPGWLSGLAGSLEAKGDGHKKQKLKVVGSVGRSNYDRGGDGFTATVDHRFVTFAFEPNDLDLESGELFIGPDGDSFLLTRPGEHGSQIRYTMDCKDSVLRLPQGSDLALEGTMRLITEVSYGIGVQPPVAAGETVVRIDVTNIGNLPVDKNVARVSVDGREGMATLYPGRTRDAVAAALLAPQQHGYLEVKLTGAALAPCAQYDVKIDLGRKMQSGRPDPFANDSARLRTPCFTWNTVAFDGASYNPRALHFAPDNYQVYGNLQQIVSSQQVGRSDGAVCSSCHYKDAKYKDASGTYVPNRYAPEMLVPGDKTTITPDTVIGGGTWRNYWAYRFLTHVPGTLPASGVKPAELRQRVQAWLETGAR